MFEKLLLLSAATAMLMSATMIVSAKDKNHKTTNHRVVKVEKAIPRGFVYVPTVFAADPLPELSRFDLVYSHFPHWDITASKGDRLASP